MIQKLFSLFIMSSTLLFSDSIVGAWTIDKSKAEQAVKAYAQDEMEEFFASMMLMAMMDIEFNDDGSCKMRQKSISKCWKQTTNQYILYGDKGGGKSADIEILDANHILLKLRDKKMPKTLEVTYNRVNVITRIAPKITMKKDKVYHAKNIKNEMLADGGDGFLIFTAEDEYYTLLTDAFTSCSKEKLKSIIKKDKSDKSGFLLNKGAYTVDSGHYKVRDNAFYTLFEGKEIEVLSDSHIRYGGECSIICVNT